MPNDPLVQQLHTLAQENPDLKSAAELYAIILPLLRDADLHVGKIALAQDAIRPRIENGLPLLHDLELELDFDAARELFMRLARAIEDYRGDEKSSALRLPFTRGAKENAAAKYIRRALETNALDVEEILFNTMGGDRRVVDTLALENKLDAPLLWMLAQNSLKPALYAWQKQLTPLTYGMEWQKGFCFICGAGATLGELQGNDQVKHLRCGQCGADWMFHRLRCMYCGNDDHKTLTYLSIAQMGGQVSLETCDNCKGYSKLIPTFAPHPHEMIIVQDLATLPLDYIAQEKGYARVAFR